MSIAMLCWLHILYNIKMHVCIYTICYTIKVYKGQVLKYIKDTICYILCPLYTVLFENKYKELQM